MQEDALADWLGEVIAGAHAKCALSHEENLPARRRRELAEATKLAISQRLDRPPTLSELAAAFECSPFHLSRLFRQTVGITLRAYLGRLRTRAGAERLAFNPTTGLSRLAFELGYSDHSHFTNAFRQEFGLPPSRFAARSAAQEVPSRSSS
jgi:AraC-like DNA-binding protein